MKSTKDVYNKANQVRTELLLFTDKEIQRTIKQNKNHKCIQNISQEITADYSHLTYIEENFTYTQEIKYCFLSSEKNPRNNNIKTCRNYKINSKCSTVNSSSKLRKKYDPIICNKQKEQTSILIRNNSYSIKEKSRRKSCFNIQTPISYLSSKNNKKSFLKKKKVVKNLSIKSKINARRFLKHLCFSLRRHRGRLESSNLCDKLKNKYENKNNKKYNNDDSNNNLAILKNMSFMSTKRIKLKRSSVIPYKNIELFSNMNIINNVAGNKRKSLFFRK